MLHMCCIQQEYGNFTSYFHSFSFFYRSEEFTAYYVKNSFISVSVNKNREPDTKTTTTRIEF